MNGVFDMRKKKDMYIQYERSYKRRRRRPHHTFAVTLAVVLALLIAGLTLFILLNHIYWFPALIIE
jgi:cell division protein FtsX